MHRVVHGAFDASNLIGGGLRARPRVNEISMATDAGHIFRQGCMDHLTDLTGRLDARGGMAAYAGHVALLAHVLTHALGELSAPLGPCFAIVEVRRHFRKHVPDAGGDMRKGLNEKVVHRDVALAATWLDACGVADMRRLQVVRVGRRTGMRVGRTAMVVAGCAERVSGRVLVEFHGSDGAGGADQGGDKQDQYKPPRDRSESNLFAEHSHGGTPQQKRMDMGAIRRGYAQVQT